MDENSSMAGNGYEFFNGMQWIGILQRSAHGEPQKHIQPVHYQYSKMGSDSRLILLDVDQESEWSGAYLRLILYCISNSAAIVTLMPYWPESQAFMLWLRSTTLCAPI